jgi:Ca2+:H+ antiporter
VTDPSRRNAAQLITSVLLLKTKQIGILKASFLGGILQNLLIMTGLAFLIGGIGRQQQYFNRTVAQTMSMFLLLAVLSLLVPTLSALLGDVSPQEILTQSRGTAIVIMLSYILFLIFQLWTNQEVFTEPSQKVPRLSLTPTVQSGQALRSLAATGAGIAAAAGGNVNSEFLIYEEDEEEAESLSPIFAMVIVCIFTTLLAFNTQFATDSLQSLTTQHGLTETFVGIVILPVLSNDVVVLKVASQDKMDKALKLTLERAIQMALMVVPLVVLIALGLHFDDFGLDFDRFSVASLFASVIIVSYVVQEGKSNW